MRKDLPILAPKCIFRFWDIFNFFLEDISIDFFFVGGVWWFEKISSKIVKKNSSENAGFCLEFRGEKSHFAPSNVSTNEGEQKNKKRWNAVFFWSWYVQCWCCRRCLPYSRWKSLIFIKSFVASLFHSLMFLSVFMMM